MSSILFNKLVPNHFTSLSFIIDSFYLITHTLNSEYILLSCFLYYPFACSFLYIAINHVKLIHLFCYLSAYINPYNVHRYSHSFNITHTYVYFQLHLNFILFRLLSMSLSIFHVYSFLSLFYTHNTLCSSHNCLLLVSA